MQFILLPRILDLGKWIPKQHIPEHSSIYLCLSYEKPSFYV